LPGEDIIGFITRGRGITIHSRNCPNAAAITDIERKIEVEWDVERGQSFLIKLEAVLQDRKNLLREITDVISEADINVRGAEIKTDVGAPTGSSASGVFHLEVTNLAQLKKAINKVKKIPGVIAISRSKGQAADE
jgi:GTP pyrophosphokinase